MSTRMQANAQKFGHLNSTLTVTAAAQTFPTNTNFILIYNPDTANTVQISFDADTTNFPIAPGASLSLDCDNFPARNTFHLKSSASTIAVKIIYGYEA